MCKSISDHKLVNAWVYATIMTDEWSWVELTKKWEMNFMAPVIFIVPMFGIKEIVVSWNGLQEVCTTINSNTWRSNIWFSVLIEMLENKVWTKHTLWPIMNKSPKTCFVGWMIYFFLIFLDTCNYHIKTSFLASRFPNRNT